MAYYMYEVYQAYDKVTGEPIKPEIYKKGNKVGENSYDNFPSCNINTEKWGIDPNGGYLCQNGEKYEKYVKMYLSSDGTWKPYTPEEYKIGNLIESDSADCGVSWRTIEEYVCEEVE